MAAAIFVVVIGIAFSSSGAAFAALPNEEGSLHPETANGAPVYGHRASEACSRLHTGNRVMAWRGADNDQVWMSFNGALPSKQEKGPDGRPAVGYSDAVAGYFMVFHTGNDE